MELYLSFVLIICFILIHVFSKKLIFLSSVPRTKLLSVGGGISIAYVFLHLLPALEKHQSLISEEVDGSVLDFLENHVYLISMVGLAAFYGLEQMVKKSKSRNETNKVSTHIFWIHIITFSLYNMLIGYLLLEEGDSIKGMIVYFIAMGLHFLTNDHALRTLHETEYDRYGRWVLTASIAVGWVVSLFFKIEPLVISVLIGILSGGVILNVMKEELPEERKSSFAAFVAGMAGYSLILFL